MPGTIIQNLGNNSEVSYSTSHFIKVISHIIISFNYSDPQYTLH